MVEMVEILDGRVGKRSVERVRYCNNNLLHLVIVKYGVISLVLCISTHLRLVTILTLLMKYLVILHADPCNKSYISHEISIEHPSVGLVSLAQLFYIMVNGPPDLRKYALTAVRGLKYIGNVDMSKFNDTYCQQQP